MSAKSFFSKIYAKRVSKKIEQWAKNPIRTQKQIFDELINKGSLTKYGKDHHFNSIKNYDDFKKNVPIISYEDLKPYIDKVVKGEEDILWPGKPLYLAKTSGTTSGAKFIPISKESMSNHINSARNAILNYIHETGNAEFVSGKMIFLQGNPILQKINGVNTGRLSGIVAHHVPSYLQKNRLPSFEANSIEDWETKVNQIVKETQNEDMTLISGIPSWVQMYFEKLLENSDEKTIKDIFPNFSLFIYGGVNFAPYKEKFYSLIGKEVPSIELYPASEGFIAFQNEQEDEGMLLILNEGIFYEFIPADEYFNENPTRISLKDVQIGVNYALIINSNAGLWGYSIGDTVMFTSLEPYKIKVSGRIKHFISAFGEHVIGIEVERALKHALEMAGGTVTEFHVAPQVNPVDGLPYHEWFIEFDEKPNKLEFFAEELDQSLQNQNIYYKDLIDGNLLKQAVVRIIEKNGFQNMMRKRGKLGGQNKIPRLSNDRAVADLF